MADQEGFPYAALMRLRLLAAIAAAVAAAVLVVELVSTQSLAGSHARANRPSVVQAKQAPQRVRAEKLSVADLTLSQLAGQRIIYAYQGATPPAELLRVIRRGEAAGVILYSPNIRSAAQTARAVKEMQTAALASPIHLPLLVMTDQEGGLIRRLPGPPYLSERQIGESPSPRTLAAEAGANAATTLKAAGINVDLAPVLDVYRNPGNFIDHYQRSYSRAPGIVATLAGAFITVLQRRGVAATAKHFPGLGAATADQNTDEAQVTLSVPLPELSAVDETPYRTAIADKVRLIMTSWAIYPAVDPTRPAGLSPTIIKGELRRRLKFRGVTITDSLGSGALVDYGSLEHRATLAAIAGADLLLCSEPLPAEDKVHDGIAALEGLTSALRSGSLGLNEARAAAARVLTLRTTIA